MSGRVRFFAVCWGAWLSSSCGAGEHTDIPPADDAPTLVEVTPSVNLCPVFRGSLVIPVDIPTGVLADVIVLVSDPDGSDARLQYAWSADAGTFTELALPVTKYRCATLGARVLRVTVRDPIGCVRRADLNVNCVDH